MTNSSTVQSFLDAYRTADLERATELMADGFTFTTPQDDHIDKAAYLERCFPTADRFSSQTVLYLTELDADTVFLMYEYELVDGGRYRNTEVSTVRDGVISEVQVFFGGAV